MGSYERKVDLYFRKLKKADRKSRRKNRLRKVRSDVEAMEYRRKFDEYYDNTIGEFIRVIEEENMGMPNPGPNKAFSETIHTTRYHEYLEERLAVPHALAKFLNYATNSRGQYQDLAKFCNILALTPAVGQGDNVEYPRSYKEAWYSHVAGLKELGIITHLSEGGMKTGIFIYWLIYDLKTSRINFQLLIDVADKTKGSFGDFKSLLSGLWLLRKSNSEDTMEFYYDTILKAKE